MFFFFRIFTLLSHFSLLDSLIQVNLSSDLTKESNGIPLVTRAWSHVDVTFFSLTHGRTGNQEAERPPRSFAQHSVPICAVLLLHSMVTQAVRCNSTIILPTIQAAHVWFPEGFPVSSTHATADTEKKWVAQRTTSAMFVIVSKCRLNSFSLEAKSWQHLWSSPCQCIDSLTSNKPSLYKLSFDW